MCDVIELKIIYECDLTKTAAKYFTEAKYSTVYDETNYYSLMCDVIEL